MKAKHIFIYIWSLLLASLFPTTVYGGESSQAIGDDNNCPTQIINSDGSKVNCNIYYINGSEANPNINQPNPLPEVSENISNTESASPVSSSHFSPDGYKPEESPPLEISTLNGYKPEASPPLGISTPSGYKPEESPPLEISQP